MRSSESEKLLERKLPREVKKVGGWCLKLLSQFVTGLPDRMCLFPGGRVVFVELKGTGLKPTNIQKAVHRKLIRLGFDCRVIDSTEGIKQLIKDVTQGEPT